MIFIPVILLAFSSGSFGAALDQFKIEDKKNEIVSLLTMKKGKKRVNLKSLLLRPTLDHFRFVGVVEFKHPAEVLSRIARDIESYKKWIKVANKKGSPVIFDRIEGNKSAGLVTIYFTSSMMGKKVKLVYSLITSVIEGKNGEAAVLMRYSSDKKIIRKLNIDIVLVGNGDKKTLVYYDFDIFFDWRGYFVTNEMFNQHVMPVMNGIITSLKREASKRMR